MGTECSATVFAVNGEGATEALTMKWGYGLRWEALEERGFGLDEAVDLFHVASRCSH